MVHRMSSPRIQAFTLVELLVTIAIVAILVALVFLGGRKALDTAKSAKKTGNLRAIGAAHSLYLADNNGFCLPTNITSDGTDPEIAPNNRAWWCHYLLPYLENNPKFFYNPHFKAQPGNDRTGTRDDVVHPFGGGTPTDAVPAELHRIEAGFGWNWYRESPGAGDQGDWAVNVGATINDPRRTMGSIASPSRLIICLESVIVVGGPDPSIGITFDLWKTLAIADPNFGLGPRWHGDSITCLFFDGHVSAMKPQDFAEENFAPLR